MKTVYCYLPDTEDSFIDFRHCPSGIVGSLSLLSIITIVLEIAFYVYFHWIL